MPDNSASIVKRSLADDDEAAGRNRRREMRLQCDPANVVLDITGHSEPVEGQIVEVSKSGLQLRLENSVPAGQTVRVTRASMIINGQIRYCRPNDAGSFDTGVEILDVQYTH
jgi:hypothetical protein